MTQPPSLPRPARDTRVDIVRGWLQLTIFASHAAGSWIGAWAIHGAWGLSDSSEQFVFLSGLMLGSVFARKSLREGWPAATRDMLRRTARLYRTQLIVFALFGAMIMLATITGLFPHEVQRLGWGFMVQHPVRASLAALTTLYQPDYMDILPVFIWCMLALPLFAWLEAQSGDWALAVPVAVYLAARWFALVPPSLGPDTEIGFNPFAWQILFLVGAWLGRRVLLLGRALPPWRWLTVVAVLVLLGGFYCGWIGSASCHSICRSAKPRQSSARTPWRFPAWRMRWRWPGWYRGSCRRRRTGCEWRSSAGSLRRGGSACRSSAWVCSCPGA